MQIGSFEHNLTTDLLNHLVFLQKVFMKEVNEVIQKVSGNEAEKKNKKTDVFFFYSFFSSHALNRNQEDGRSFFISLKSTMGSHARLSCCNRSIPFWINAV